MDPSTIKLQDCSVGQLRLLFRLTPTTLLQHPPLMVISKSIDQYEIIFASQI
ncbi:hypothetical protein FRC07_006519, partial [Ceratobasidium sp. 392]